MYKRVNELLGTKFKSNEEINWNDISKNYDLSESFINEFKYQVRWDLISMFQTLSEPFIRKFRFKVNWFRVSSFQILSESFIREFKDEVDWVMISSSQLLSWNFILEFENKLFWDYISAFQPYIDPSYEKIDKLFIRNNNLYFLYQLTKNRGWFVGYIKDIDKKNSEFFQKISKNNKNFNFKAKIYWKDMKSLNKIDKFEIIREIKYV